jgi:hypothetical protein
MMLQNRSSYRICQECEVHQGVQLRLEVEEKVEEPLLLRQCYKYARCAPLFDLEGFDKYYFILDL